jgi:prepilin-type N-terminal cleavage/methylation domain-containing protein
MNRNHRPAFTLIEVLIGVMVLALGLLGLGAVIPVVVRQQRQSMEAQLGLEAAKAARAYLTARPDLDPSTPMKTVGNPPVLAPSTGWDVWLMDRANWSPQVPQGPAVDSYLWAPWRTSGTKLEIALTQANVPNWANNAGDFGWHATGPGPARLHCDITLADRSGRVNPCRARRTCGPA